jgi:SAM-dependent methyltransferase
MIPLPQTWRKHLKYYFWASFRRKILDALQEEFVDYYRGKVLDIGGRDRGRFKKPKHKVKQWIFADIEKKHSPDIVLNVTNMRSISSSSIDVVSAIELFEHVYEIEKGLNECIRVLNREGVIILSVPFLYQVHGDPDDFQRWTLEKWLREFKKMNLKPIETIITGNFFTVISDMIKQFFFSFSYPMKLLFYPFQPLFSLITCLDKTKFVQKNLKLKAYHGGYFFILKKID